MDLDISELAEPGFEGSSEFNDYWWTNRMTFGEAVHLEVRNALEVVARVEIDQTVGVSGYEGQPDLSVDCIDITFFEVAASHRGQGIGSQLVELLADHYPARRLFAISHDADEFWSSLGWDGFKDPDRINRGTLFVRQDRA